jgi:hypothetical protein
MERLHSRYTRAKTWAALNSQFVNAGYALVPHSETTNSIDVISCGDQAKVKLVMQQLLENDQIIAKYYARPTDDEYLAPYQLPGASLKTVTAVVLAKSSDYYHYHLMSKDGIQLIICGLHDSYMQWRVWETSTNKRYEPRATSVPIPHLVLGKGRTLDHNILLGALICGDQAAIAYRDDKTKMSRWTRNRMIREVETIQSTRYRGRPLAFLNGAKSKEIGGKISQSLIEYHKRRKSS